MIDFLTILNRLGESKVEFVLVGALSAAVQGAQISTIDVDIVHCRSAGNCERLAEVLQGLGARYRSHPNIKPTADRLAGPGHQLLTTDFGPLDVLGEIEDGLGYVELLDECERISIGEHVVRTLSLTKYLQLRRAHPRARDHARFPLIEAAISAANDPASGPTLVTIHVALLNEGVDVLRPVESVPIAENRARLGPAIDTSEKWQFPSGTVVIYETRSINGEEVLVAIAQE